MRIEIPWGIKKLYLNHLNIPNRFRTNQEIFTRAYKANASGSRESVSGPGSTLEYTAPMRQELPRLFNRYYIRSILDAPCGDFNWMKIVDFKDINQYIGVDVVPDLIRSNEHKHADNKRSFKCLDLTCDHLPTADLIICRDLFFHLSFSDVFSVIRNFKVSGSGYLLATTHLDHANTTDIITGGFRLINIERSPFNLPKAIEYIPDRGHYKHGHKQYQRHLGLWQLGDIV
jgi:hypothetical protein